MELLQGQEILLAKQLAQAMNSRKAKINEINRRERKSEVYANAIYSPLPKKKSIRKPQIEAPGIQSSKGITWFRSDGKIVNHIYPDVPDRRCGVEVKPRTIYVDRPSIDAQRHKKKAGYDDLQAMKTIKARERQRKAWRKQMKQV